MENLILKYYPEQAFYTFMYLVEKCGRLDYCTADVDKQHLEDLETSGFIKLIDDKIFVKEKGEWLHQPPKPKFKEKKEQWLNPRLDKLANIVGYPADWHKRTKYESRYRNFAAKRDWEEILKVANYFKENKPDPDLVLNYFLSEGGYKGIVNLMNNPKKEKEKKILYRDEITKDQDEQNPW